MKKLFLSDQSKTIILGSLLGDGSLKIHHPYKNARFSFRHSIHQKDYFDWKVKHLKEISSDKYVWQQKPDGFGGVKLRYQSRALEALTELHCTTHKRNKLRIKRKWLNLLTPLSLAIWWLDDGSIIGNGRKGVFCTDDFSHDELKILAQYLKKVWKIKVAIGRVGKTGRRKDQYRLWIRSTGDLKKLLRIILPHIKVSSILSKIIILYKNSKLQQRWTSEICKLTGFSKKLIEKLTLDKKSKWKNFR